MAERLGSRAINQKVAMQNYVVSLGKALLALGRMNLYLL